MKELKNNKDMFRLFWKTLKQSGLESGVAAAGQQQIDVCSNDQEFLPKQKF